MNPPWFALPRQPTSIVPMALGQRLIISGGQIVRLKEVVEGGTEDGSDFAGVQLGHDRVFDKGRGGSGGFAVSVEEGDAGYHHEVVSGQAWREITDLFYSEGFGEAVIIFWETDFLICFPSSYLICHAMVSKCDLPNKCSFWGHTRRLFSTVGLTAWKRGMPREAP